MPLFRRPEHKVRRNRTLSTPRSDLCLADAGLARPDNLFTETGPFRRLSFYLAAKPVPGFNSHKTRRLDIMEASGFVPGFDEL